MSLRPFLCHCREDRRRLEDFRAALSVAGADGWQDIDDLRLGRPSEKEIERVIREEAGGFLWLGTLASTRSRFVRRTEVPAALARTARQEAFPVVPVFADVRPTELRVPRLAWPAWRTSLLRLKDFNGVLREAGEPDEGLWQRAAAQYVRHAIIARGSEPVSAAVSCVSAPDRAADLVLDWRGLIDADHALDPGRLAHAHISLANLRAAFQEASVPLIRVAPDLFLPLAVLLGREWGALTGLKLEIAQRTGAQTSIVSSDLLAAGCTTPVARRARRGRGPVVVVVSAPEPVDGAAERYADQMDAQEIVRLHDDRLLSPVEIGGLASRVATLLGQLSDQGRDKHLIIRGPVSLAILIGAAGNTMGRTTVPLWDRTNGYLPGVVVGGGAACSPHRARSG